jgi:glycosyltransferase involved in cell wall biosynthesis
MNTHDFRQANVDSPTDIDLANLHARPTWIQDRVFAQSHAEVAHAILHDFADSNPHIAARQGIRKWQKRAALGVAAIGVTAAVLAPSALLIALVGLTSLIVMLSFIVAITGLRSSRDNVRRRQYRHGGPELTDEQLPTYTVLVPAYREEEVIGDLVRCLARLDYPRERLEVLLLVERTDVATQLAIAAADPPPFMRVLQVPPGPPRTKPRSCNAGLLVAKGELLVIFDAEDRPEPDQLRRAAAMFAANPAELACVQAVLQTSNVRTSLLAHCFGVEYAVRFRLVLPGLAALGIPFPLGGTSNHFRTRVLRDVGGWDAWNVTEDADLGMRLHALGYRTGVIDSVTYGDAPDRLRDWISQRTRWHKGYLLTALVHARAPRETVRRFGPRGLLGLLVLVLGTPLQYLAQTIIFVVSAGILLGYRGLVRVDIDGAEMAVIEWGTTLIWLLAAYLAHGQQRPTHLRAIAALPVYWLAHWVAAWRAVYQLATAPFHWEKTAHRSSAANPGVNPAGRVGVALPSAALGLVPQPAT